MPTVSVGITRCGCSLLEIKNGVRENNIAAGNMALLTWLT